MPLLPAPVHFESRPGTLDVAAVRVIAEEAATVALASRELAAHGVDVRPDGATAVTLVLDPAAGPEGAASPERYTLAVEAAGIRIGAPTVAGLAHGVRTLVRLVDDEGAGSDAGGETGGRAFGEGPSAAGAGAGRHPVVPRCVVTDAPRYAWRGLSVDIARHFFGPEVLRRIIDLAASYKLNVLHLHLTDDQGWRIECPSWPLLVERASGGSTPGYLSLKEYRDLQEYAAREHIVVVPEFDSPGHTNAACHAYGQLRPDGKATDWYEGLEVGFSTLTWGLASTEPFLRGVLGDIVAATAGPYVHIGGDEAHQTGPEDYARLVELAARIVAEQGKVPVAWQEAAGAAPLVELVQFWDTKTAKTDRIVAAAQAGARIILSPADRIYLDMMYTADYPKGQDWAGLVELRDSYEWDPDTVIPGLPAKSIAGVEAAIFTETLKGEDELFAMLLPRLAAAAEVAWTPAAKRDWPDFRARVAREADAWRAARLAFHPTPQVDW